MTNSMKLPVLARVLAVAFLVLFLSATYAQPAGYPNRSIRVIVPAGSGDSCDILSRLVAQRMAERLGQPLVIDNRAGSSGQLGLMMIKQAAPDGYTLGCGQGGSMVIVPLAYSKVGYDSVRDFAPVALMASNFLALAVSPRFAVNSTLELIAYAKANPGKVTFGTNGEGAFLHFATEQFRLMAGFDYLHVAYRSMAAVFTDMLAGQINATLASYISAQPLAAGGKIRILGIARAQRLPELPDVPTLAEAVPGFTSGGWFGLIAPAGTPRDIVNLLNREANLALSSPEVSERMKTLGLESHGESPEAFARLIQDDFANWGKVVTQIGFKPL